MGIFVGGADKKKNTNTRAPRSVGSPGFTLLELLVTILIASVLLAIATPSFSEFRLNARMTSTANDLLAAVQLARTEAAKRQLPVSLCALQNPAGDEPVCSGGDLDTVAAQGWLVFVDPNRDCARVAGTDAVILVTSRAQTDDGVTSQAAGNCISFGANGFLVQPNVAIVLCDRRGMRTQGGSGHTYARAITLTPTGAARITRDASHFMGLICPTV